MPRRLVWVWVHRVAGLSLALFLVLTSLTGSVLAFLPDYAEVVVPPERLPERPGPTLDALTLRDLAQQYVGPGVILDEVLLEVPRDRPYRLVAIPRPDPVTGQAVRLSYLYIALDPVTGRELRRISLPTSSSWPLTRQNIVDVLIRLHTALMLPATPGRWLMGAVAALWMIDSIVGLVLTWPNRRSDRGRSWLARWWNPSWLVKTNAAPQRLNHDVHRAGGLWLWVLLVLMAFSALSLSLRDQVFMPLMHSVFDMHDPVWELPALASPRDQPRLDWRTGLARARQLMAEQARRQGFIMRENGEFWISYDRTTGAYLYDACSSRDLLTAGCGTIIAFDGDSGDLLAFRSLVGHQIGHSVDFWIMALHMGLVGGLPYRIFLALFGVAVTVLSVSGVVIWWVRWRARRFIRMRMHRAAVAR